MPAKGYANTMMLYGSFMAYTWIFSFGLPVFSVREFRERGKNGSLLCQLVFLSFLSGCVGVAAFIFHFSILMNLAVPLITIVYFGLTIIPNIMIRVLGAYLQADGRINISSFIQFVLRNVLLLLLSVFAMEVYDTPQSISLAIFTTHFIILSVYVVLLGDQITSFRLVDGLLPVNFMNILKQCCLVLLAGFSFQILMQISTWASQSILAGVEFAYVVTLMIMLSQLFMLLTSSSSVIYPKMCQDERFFSNFNK